uniref:Uncharacterized protein n=1 Tax=Tanacetum cinerariifolium TaxID=118510 RepID=A0A699HPU8_TANCI|nr:hypothetical protein [Tanacetum cinerariifolium]
MVEEVTFLKKDFKQKENKYLADFLDMKSLKEKVKDRLIKQEQSLQTVYMLCRPNPYYNEQNMVAIGYKNPLCLTRAKQKVTLEIAEIIRKKMNARMNDPEYVFEELEAEVAQYVVDRKHDAIEWKNLLIANDNLIVKCLSKEVFYVAINSELNVARFTEMTVAHTVVEARCLELEAELAKLRNTSHHDNQEELIDRFSKLEADDSRCHGTAKILPCSPLGTNTLNNGVYHKLPLRKKECLVKCQLWKRLLISHSCKLLKNISIRQAFNLVSIIQIPRLMMASVTTTFLSSIRACN